MFVLTWSFTVIEKKCLLKNLIIQFKTLCDETDICYGIVISLTHDQLPIASFTEMRLQKLKMPKSQDCSFVIWFVFFLKFHFH